MNGLIAKIAALATTVAFTSGQLAAAPAELGRSVRDVREVMPMQPASEYYMTHLPGEILVPVNVIGGVGRPGLYYVPKNTDIYRLIAAAGGIRPESEKESISIKRRLGKQDRIITIDFGASLQDPNAELVVLEAEDVVIVPYREPLISQDSMSLIGVVSSVLSIVISVFVLQKALE